MAAKAVSAALRRSMNRPVTDNGQTLVARPASLTGSGVHRSGAAPQPVGGAGSTAWSASENHDTSTTKFLRDRWWPGGRGILIARPSSP